MDSNNLSSPFELLTSLCERIIENEFPEALDKQKDAILKRTRTLAYGIILSKNVERGNKPLKNNPVASLVSESFSLGCLGLQSEKEELDCIIKRALTSGWSENAPLALDTLVCLTDSVKEESETFGFCHPVQIRKHAGQLTNDNNNNNNNNNNIHPFRICPVSTFVSPSWMDMSHRTNSFQYHTKFPFLKPPSGDINFCRESNKAICRKKSTYPLLSITPLSGPKDFTETLLAPQELYSLHPTYNLEKEIAPKETDPTQIWADALHAKLPQRRSWENLGCLVPNTEPAFISLCSSESFPHIATVCNAHYSSDCTSAVDTPPTTDTQFIIDVFYLLIGIDSQSFQYDQDKGEFLMQQRVWIQGYTSKSLSFLCEDFLFCGTNYKKIDYLCHNQEEQVEKHSILHTFHASIRRWVQFYRAAVLVLKTRVLSQSNVLIFDLLNKISPIKLQVESVARLCNIHNSTGNIISPLPRGDALLAHVYREVSLSLRRKQTCTLYSVLKSCCQVYLQRLERWIFDGECSYVKDEEFFVHVNPEYFGERNRAYWSKGFVLASESVPDFLRGMEVAIFECGRAGNLLKLCNPQHPLCIMLEKQRPLTLRCCLFKSDLEVVQKECYKFEKEAQKVCGEQMTVAKQLEEEHQHSIRVTGQIQKLQEDRTKRYFEEKTKKAKETLESKQKQLMELKAQISAANQRKLEDQERARLEDAKYLENCKLMEEKQLKKQEDERQKLFCYYEELNAHIQKRERHAEWQEKRLKLTDRRKEFLQSDKALLAQECSGLVTQMKTANLEVTPSDATSRNLEFVLNIDKDSPKKGSLVTPPQEIPRQEHIITEVKIVPVNKTTENKTSLLQLEDYDFKKSSEVLEKENQTDKKIGEDIFNLMKNTRAAALENKKKILGMEFDLQTSDKSPAMRQNLYPNTTNESEINKKELSDLEKNRQKVLNEEFKRNDSVSLPRGNNFFNDTELSKNRRKVMESEFNIFTGEKTDARCNDRNLGVSSELTDLQKNRRKVLGEEYHFVYRNIKANGVPPSSDSNFSISSEEKKNGDTQIEDKSLKVIVSDLPAEEINNTECEKIHSVLQKSPVDVNLETTAVPDNNFGVSESIENVDANAKRPNLLGISNFTDQKCYLSPIYTPMSSSDALVSSSPFRRTYASSYHLALATPMCEKLDRRNIPRQIFLNGCPLNVDIFDSVNSKSPAEKTPDEYDAIEMSQVTTGLGSSLQCCLLSPLTLQHNFVSKALVHHYLADLKLLSHFRSLRSYFFMMDGEFGRHLTSQLFTRMYEVTTPVELLNGFVLNSLLSSALAGSQGSSDPNSMRLSFSVNKPPHHFSHYSPNALDCLQMQYRLEWPLNIIFTDKLLQKYNKIFLFLVRLRRVAFLLQDDFTVLKHTAWNCNKEQRWDLLNSSQYHQVQMIRHTMSQFVQATLNYVSSAVLHASWANFKADLIKSSTLDDIYNAHVAYIRRIFRRSILSQKCQRVEAVVTEILGSILHFHSQMRVRAWQAPPRCDSCHSTCSHLEHPNFKHLLLCFNKFKLQMSKFVCYLEKLASPPNEQEHLAEYLLLLNLNGFFEITDYLRCVEKSQSLKKE